MCFSFSPGHVEWALCADCQICVRAQRLFGATDDKNVGNTIVHDSSPLALQLQIHQGHFERSWLSFLECSVSQQLQYFLSFSVPWHALFGIIPG